MGSLKKVIDNNSRLLKLLLLFVSIGILYKASNDVLHSEIDILHPNKWKIFIFYNVLFSIIFLFVSFIKKSAKRLTPFFFFFSVLFLVCFFSESIIDYQYERNLKKVNDLIEQEESKGLKDSNKYYVFGLSVYNYQYQYKNGKILSISFKGKYGTLQKYDFIKSKWSNFD